MRLSQRLAASRSVIELFIGRLILPLHAGHNYFASHLEHLELLQPARGNLTLSSRVQTMLFPLLIAVALFTHGAQAVINQCSSSMIKAYLPKCGLGYNYYYCITGSANTGCSLDPFPSTSCSDQCLLPLPDAVSGNYVDITSTPAVYPPPVTSTPSVYPPTQATNPTPGTALAPPSPWGPTIELCPFETPCPLGPFFYCSYVEKNNTDGTGNQGGCKPQIDGPFTWGPNGNECANQCFVNKTVTQSGYTGPTIWACWDSTPCPVGGEYFFCTKGDNYNGCKQISEGPFPYGSGKSQCSSQCFANTTATSSAVTTTVKFNATGCAESTPCPLGKLSHPVDFSPIQSLSLCLYDSDPILPSCLAGGTYYHCLDAPNNGCQASVQGPFPPSDCSSQCIVTTNNPPGSKVEVSISLTFNIGTSCASIASDPSAFIAAFKADTAAAWNLKNPISSQISPQDVVVSNVVTDCRAVARRSLFASSASSVVVDAVVKTSSLNAVQASQASAQFLNSAQGSSFAASSKLGASGAVASVDPPSLTAPRPPSPPPPSTSSSTPVVTIAVASAVGGVALMALLVGAVFMVKRRATGSAGRGLSAEKPQSRTSPANVPSTTTYHENAVAFIGQVSTPSYLGPTASFPAVTSPKAIVPSAGEAMIEIPLHTMVTESSAVRALKASAPRVSHSGIHASVSRPTTPTDHAAAIPHPDQARRSSSGSGTTKPAWE